MNRRFNLSLAMSTIVLLSGVALSDSAAAGGSIGFQFVAKFTCGFDPQTKINRVLPGQYATAIVIQNPSYRHQLTFAARVALVFPPSVLAPGPVSPTIELALGANQALEIDCEELRGTFFGGVPLPPYFQGFVTIETKRPLVVAATYTTAQPDADGNLAVTSIDVEQIRGTLDR